MSQEYNGFTIPAYTDTADAVAMFQNYTDDVTTKLAAKLTGEVTSSAPSPATAGKVWVDSGTKQGFFGTGSAWVPFTGKILQVVRATDTSQRSTNSGSFVDVPGMAVTITPLQASSKILVIATGYVSPRSTTAVQTNGAVRIVNSSTPVSGAESITLGSESQEDAYIALCLMGWDSPATTSAVTYKVQYNASTGVTMYFFNNGMTGQVFAIEVAA